MGSRGAVSTAAAAVHRSSAKSRARADTCTNVEQGRNQTQLGQVVGGTASNRRFNQMNGIIYLVGLVVIVMAILSFIGLN